MMVSPAGIGLVAAVTTFLQPDVQMPAPLETVRVAAVSTKVDTGPVTDMAKWKGPDGQEVLGLAGLKNIVHLAADNTVLGQYPMPHLDSNGAPGARLAWVNTDNQGAPELITLEYPMSRSVKVFTAEGALKWTWTLPAKIDAPFGIHMVHPFMADGKLGVAVWIDGDPGFVLDESGTLVRRQDWGRVNGRGMIQRFGSYAHTGAVVVYGAGAKIRAVNDAGIPTHEVKLPPRNRFIRSVIASRSSPEPAVLVSSTFGYVDEKAYKIVLPKDGPAVVEEVEVHALHARGDWGQLQARLWPEGPPVWIRCDAGSSQAPGVGLSGKVGIIELRVGQQEPRELTLAPRDGRPLPVFPPVAFNAGVRPDGTDRVLIGWETGLYELTVNQEP